MKTFTMFTIYMKTLTLFLSEEIQLSFCAATENSTTKIVLFIAMALISVVKSDLQVFPEYQKRPILLSICT